MAVKPNFTRKKKRARHGTAFWDREYSQPEHLKLSTAESGDLAKFTRWLVRRDRTDILSPEGKVADIGCGNGRNLIFLAEQFGMTGFGVDISTAAIKQAKEASKEYNLSYAVQSASSPLPLPDGSQDLVLDMMTSHFLNTKDRSKMLEEVHRILKPGGYFFLKTFLLDGDLHSKRLLKDHPGPEENSYIHPVLGVAEYVYTEKQLTDFLSEKFNVIKVYRSHKHVFRGRARKRRTISIYVEKDIKD